MNEEMPKRCPNCRNHCFIDALRCIKGRQWKMIIMDELKKRSDQKCK